MEPFLISVKGILLYWSNKGISLRHADMLADGPSPAPGFTVFVAGVLIVVSSC
jgi:hypothetical protein